MPESGRPAYGPNQVISWHASNSTSICFRSCSDSAHVSKRRRSSATRPIDGIYERSAMPRTHDRSRSTLESSPKRPVSTESFWTNAKVTPLQAVLRCRDLLQVENLFLRTKAIMRTRPIFHSSDAAIRGHVFCSFLALAMQKHLDDLLRETGVTPEWKELLRDLDRLQNVRLEHRGADWLVRTDATRNVASLFRHAHIALPPRAKQTAPPKAASSSIPIRKRRGRPKRSATSSRISPQLV